MFATDALITALMCATRSVYSWDVIVERRGDFLFFDKRDGSNLDMLTGTTSRQAAAAHILPHTSQGTAAVHSMNGPFIMPVPHLNVSDAKLNV